MFFTIMHDVDTCYYCTHFFLYPKTTGRPSFASLHHKLSRPESLLLKWTDGDKTRDPQSTMLRAPLETASDLHSDLQHKYVR